MSQRARRVQFTLFIRIAIGYAPKESACLTIYRRSGGRCLIPSKTGSLRISNGSSSREPLGFFSRRPLVTVILDRAFGLLSAYYGKDSLLNKLIDPIPFGSARNGPEIFTFTEPTPNILNKPGTYMPQNEWALFNLTDPS
jgi:hypothetical protein